MFNLKILTKQNNYRLRMEKNKKLHFQIDITCNDEMIKEKIEKNNYFILSFNNEKKIRLMELMKNPNKTHHRNWLVKNKVI